MERDSIVFYKDWWEAISGLPEDRQPEVIRAVMDYAFKGIEPEDTMLCFATAQIRMFIDRDQKRYDEICAKRKEAIKRRWDKAKKTKEYNCIQVNTQESTCIQPNTTLYLNDNDNDNYNDNGNGNVNDNDNKEIDKSISAAANNISRTRATAAAEATPLREKIAELKGNKVWLEQVAMKFHLTTTDEVCRNLEEFREDMELRGRQVNCPQGLFVKWLTDKKYRNSPSQPSAQSAPAPDYTYKGGFGGLDT